MHAIDTAPRASADTDDMASRQFRTFAGVLLKERIAASAVPEPEGRADATKLSHALCQLIELQSLEAGRLGGGGLDVQLPGRFLKAALADEMMLHLDWAGRAHWRHVMVEATLFHTARAGDQVFADIDALLRERDPAHRPLARLYLQLLALGFQGRYRGAASLAAIAAYRRELFQFAYQRAPGLGGRDAVLSEQPYDSTMTAGSSIRIARSSRRVVTFAATMAFLLVVSEGLWLWQAAKVRDALALPQQAQVITQAAP
jgi:type VI secretion system protein ImpK